MTVKKHKQCNPTNTNTQHQFEFTNAVSGYRKNSIRQCLRRYAIEQTSNIAENSYWKTMKAHMYGKLQV